MAKLRARGKGRWEVVVELPRQGGRRRQVSRIFHGTKRDAGDFGYELEVEVQQGRHDTQPGTLSSLLERWFAVASPDWSPATARQVRSIIDAHLAAIAETQLRRLRTVAIDDLYLQLRRKGLAPATIRRVHGVLHRALVQGGRWGWISDNPASRATLPKVVEEEVEPPEAAEVVTLIAKAEETDADLAVFIRLAAVTGARRGELCALRWRHVDDASLTILSSVVDAGGGVIVKTTKTGKKRRVALDDATLAVLARHRVSCAKRALKAGVKPDWVFESIRRPGEPWRPDNVSHRFAALRDELGLTLRLHDLRHANASWLLALGVDVRTTAGRLGHADGGRQTLGRYGHRMPAADTAAAEAVGALLEG